ncbi:MAG: MFS transporter [Planctomycetes bacterium]|nr:MFS transporter [Planctomycetota bacterium]
MDTPEVPPKQDAADEPSLRAVERQAICWAVMFGLGENAFSLFAGHLKAPASFFAYLNGIPQLLGPMTQTVAATMVDRFRTRLVLVKSAVAVQALSFLPLVLLVFVAEPGWWTHAVLLLAVVVYFLGGHFSNPPWVSLISDLVPERGRGEFFGRYTRTVLVVSLAGQTAVGVAFWIYDRPDAAAWVFLSAFAVSLVARLGSVWQLMKVREPKFEAPAESHFTFWDFLRRSPKSNYARFVFFVGMVHFGTQLSGPFFYPYWLYDLGYPPWQWVGLSAASSLAAVVTMLFWGRFADRFGAKLLMRYTSVVIALIPVWWMVFDNVWVLILSNAVGGMAWSGFGLANLNYILEAVTPAKRARCTAYFNVVIGFGTFLGAMVGGVLMEVLPKSFTLAGFDVEVRSPFFWLLGLSTIVRGGAGYLFLRHFRELREVQHFRLRGWFMSIAQARVPMGLRVMLFMPKENEKGEKKNDTDTPDHTK